MVQLGGGGAQGGHRGGRQGGFEGEDGDTDGWCQYSAKHGN